MGVFKLILCVYVFFVYEECAPGSANPDDAKERERRERRKGERMNKQDIRGKFFFTFLFSKRNHPAPLVVCHPVVLGKLDLCA